MNKLSKTTVLMEKLFWIFLFINPFLDIINGLYINLIMGVGILDVEFVSTLGVTPSLLVRMLMLVIFALYVLLVRDVKSILTAVPIGLAWLLSLVSGYMRVGTAQLFIDTQYTARFCFNIVLAMVYTRVFSKRWAEDGSTLLRKLDRIVCLTAGVLSLSILISAVAGIGYSTYADPMGYRGMRGFFYAGNDITAILTILLPLCIACTMKADLRKDKRAVILPALAVSFTANALLIIGSKTAFLALAVSCCIMLAAAIVFTVKNKNRGIIIGYITGMAAFGLLFLLLMLISRSQLLDTISTSLAVTGTVAENEGVGAAMLSGRENKLAQFFAMYKDGGVLVWLFGLGRGCRDEILEMDLFELLFYYGFFGLGAMLWLYVKLAVEFFKGFFKKPDLVSVALFTGIGLAAGYLVIAGHVLFSVTSGFYFIFAIVYSRVHFAARSEDILLWKQK